MKTLKHKVALLALAACCAGSGPAYAQQGGEPDGIPVTKMSRMRMLANAEEFEQQSRLQYTALLNEAQQKQALVPATHPQVIRLRAIAKRLIPFATRWNPESASWKWEVNLLNSSQVNAFCMPGGRIAFYTGILTKLNLTDDEVAIVMGHEIGHALREHGRERAGKAGATGLLGRVAGAGLSAWLGVDPRITGAVTGQVAQLAVLKFSREEETEADLVGMDLAARAGFDPRAGVALWEKMGQVNKNQPTQFLSTHPSGSTRIGDMNRSMPLVLPVFARAKGLNPNALPVYHSLAIPAQR
ncbi:M48 family metallopeptidase [Oxalobacteraceae bacterium]|nr:M48 family metallopeptidase [Oxalobacteraceae bacterium]